MSRHLSKFRSLWVISKRFESKIPQKEKTVEALRAFNRGNKLQFGKLLETAGSRKKRMNKVTKNDCLVVKKNSDTPVASISEVSKSLNSSSKAFTEALVDSDLVSKKSSSTKEISEAASTADAQPEDDGISDRKNKSSNQESVKRACGSTFSKKSAISKRKKSVETKIEDIGHITDGQEKIKSKKQKKVSSKSTKVQAKSENVDESVVATVIPVMEIKTPLLTERSTESKESVEHSEISYDTHNEDEVSNSSIPDPNPLLNRFKKIYTADLIYAETSPVHPNYYPYPSVSHILSESMSSSSEINLKKWKDSLVSELGDDEFQVYSKSLMHSAKSLRKLILMRLRGIPDEKLDITPELLGCWESLKFVFPLFTKVKEIGKVAVHPELKYKGMVDSLVEFRNKLVLISWKKANKYVPSLDKTYDLPVQCAACMGAVNFDPSFPFLVDEVLLVMSYTNGMKADVFHVKTDQCQRYWKLWLERLNTYRMRVKETDRQVDKEDLGKLNIEEELAKMNKTIDLSKMRDPNSESQSSNKAQRSDNFPDNSNSVDTIAKQPEKLYNFPYNLNPIVTGADEPGNPNSSFDFPLYNDEKTAYTSGTIFEFGNVNHDTFASCPAVTTVLSETKSATSVFILERWKNNMIAELGVEGFETYHKNILSTGISFHQLIQKHYQGTLEDVPDELRGCWTSLQNVFPLIKKVKLTESKVVHEKLKYKGIVDCVAEFRNKLVVIDWKKSDKLKSTINMTYDAPLQVAAYVGALNFDSNYPYRIEEGLLVFSYMDGSKADVYHLDAKNCQKYWELWLQRLCKYQNQVNSNCMKINY